MANAQNLSMCPICKNLIGKNELCDKQYCIMKRRAGNEKSMLHCKVPEMYANANVEDIDSRILNAARNGFNQQGFIYLYGKVGVGKSYLAAALMKERLPDSVVHWEDFNRAELSALWMRVASLMTKIQRGYSDREDTEGVKLYEKATKVKLLVIDDLGAHTKTEWVLSHVCDLIEERTSRYLPTIITSNLSPVEIGRHENRIRSRLEFFYQMELKGKDRRAI